MMYMGTESKARKRYQRQGPPRRQSFSRQRSGSRDSRFNPSRRFSRFDGQRSGDDDRNCDRSRTPTRSSQIQSCLGCNGCRCENCNQLKPNCQDIKKLIHKKLDVKRVNEVSTEVSPTAVNLCNQEVVMGQDMTIN